MTPEDDEDMDRAVELAEAELDAEVIEERPVRGALAEPNRVGPKMTGRRPPAPKGK